MKLICAEKLFQKIMKIVEIFILASDSVSPSFGLFFPCNLFNYVICSCGRKEMRKN